MPGSPRDKPGTILILRAPRCRPGSVAVTHIQRMSLPYEQISSGVDFSVGRIEALIEQGEQDARRAVA